VKKGVEYVRPHLKKYSENLILDILFYIGQHFYRKACFSRQVEHSETNHEQVEGFSQRIFEKSAEINLLKIPINLGSQP
jgi:hypothetical protein